MRNIFEGKRVLVIGGTGSFGKQFCRRLLADTTNTKILIFSRDEMKQDEMRRALQAEERIRFLLGDVRDLPRLTLAMRKIDYVIHAAALKIVPLGEYNPMEVIKTNILGAMNVVEAAIACGVQRVVALSTDKACLPVNLYGASKLCSDKLFINANHLSSGETTFSVVRYGNVIGSRGSVIPLFLKQRAGGTLTITHPDMTRFMITLDQGVDLVVESFRSMLGGEIYVKKIPSMGILEMANAVAPDCNLKVIGIRPGEKLHEIMISEEDAETTYEYKDFYKILPNVDGWKDDVNRIDRGIKVPARFRYSSDSNSEWMSVGALKTLLPECENFAW